MAYTRRYYTERGKRHWKHVYKVSRGPLAGRTYKTQANYRKGLERYKEREQALAKAQRAAARARTARETRVKRIRPTGIETEEKYNQLLQAYILQKGAPSARGLARFKELYRKAKAQDWEPCINKGDAYAVLLDYIGVRPLEEFRWTCIGDTPKA